MILGWSSSWWRWYCVRCLQHLPTLFQAESHQNILRLVKDNSTKEKKTWNSRFKSEGDIFQMFCPVMWLPAWAVTRMRGKVGQTLNAEKWFPCMICVSNIPPAFLAHFLSDILLLTIFVTGWLRPPVWCEAALEEKGDQDKITSASKKNWTFCQLFNHELEKKVSIAKRPL